MRGELAYKSNVVRNQSSALFLGTFSAMGCHFGLSYAQSMGCKQLSVVC